MDARQTIIKKRRSLIDDARDQIAQIRRARLLKWNGFQKIPKKFLFTKSFQQRKHINIVPMIKRTISNENGNTEFFEFRHFGIKRIICNDIFEARFGSSKMHVEESSDIEMEDMEWQDDQGNEKKCDGGEGEICDLTGEKDIIRVQNRRHEEEMKLELARIRYEEKYFRIAARSPPVKTRLTDKVPDPRKSVGIFAYLPLSIPRQFPQSPDGYKVIIKNLDHGITAEEIQELFQEFGILVSYKLIQPGLAEVIYKELREAKSAIDYYDGRLLDDKPMKCKLINPNNDW